MVGDTSKLGLSISVNIWWTFRICRLVCKTFTTCAPTNDSERQRVASFDGQRSADTEHKNGKLGQQWRDWQNWTQSDPDYAKILHSHSSSYLKIRRIRQINCTRPSLLKSITYAWRKYDWQAPIYAKSDLANIFHKRTQCSQRRSLK